MKRSLASAMVTLVAAACSGEPLPHSQHDVHLDDDFKGCPPETPVFGPGIEAKGARTHVRLVSAEPPEPERYENDWVVELSEPTLQLVRAQTFMPVHGHDGRVVPELTPLGQPGQVAVDRLNFTMRGPWEVRLWLQSPSMEEDYVVFEVCVAK